MTNFDSLIAGDVVIYVDHIMTNPDYFGHEAVVLGVFDCDEGAYVKLEVVSPYDGEKFVSTAHDPSRFELVERVVVSDDDVNRFLNEF